MSDRSYDDAEVRKILELATTQQSIRRPTRTAEGMSLAELQSIGEEVGVDPAAIARAAAALDAGALARPRTSLGQPIEVGHVVPLTRMPTDVEWERLVAELRTTFRARGRTAVHGGLREWTNGNLHACIEPVAHGHRLRRGTVKGDARALNALGATGLIAGATVAASMLLAGEVQGALVVPAIFGTAGMGAFLANMLRLPRWARQRDRQMQHIAARAHDIIPPLPDLPT
jgi:hypothetical protein